MNFLVRYFERSVKATHNEALIQEMNDKISKWESRLEYTAKEGIAMASKEAIAEEATQVAVEEVVVALPAKKLSNKQLKENAKLAGFMRKQAQESIAFYKQQITANREVEESKKELAELQEFLAKHKHSTDLAFIAAVYAKQGESK